jgi:hypothetical protein
MSGAKWTPGPWKVQSAFIGPLLITAHGQLIAKVGDADFKTAAGNAELIASAPDLYEALERIMEYAHAGARICDVDPTVQPEFVKARAALKKAKGE